MGKKAKLLTTVTSFAFGASGRSGSYKRSSNMPKSSLGILAHDSALAELFEELLAWLRSAAGEDSYQGGKWTDLKALLKLPAKGILRLT